MMPTNFREERLNQLLNECQNTVIEQILQPFGLSMAMFDDKDGGGVNTIHNARKGVYATQNEKEKFEQRGEYNSTKYHSHPGYVKENRDISVAKKEGTLIDDYTGQKIAPGEKVDLDHTIAAKTAHDDAGVYLAGLDPSDLVNDPSNLHATNSTINRSKKQKSMEQFIEDWKKNQPARQAKIKDLSAKEKLTEKEKKELEKLQNLEAFSPEQAMEIEKTAKRQYEKAVNKYYKSGKFAKSVAQDAAKTALTTAIQQALGKLLVVFAQSTFHEIKMFIKERTSSAQSIFEDIKQRLQRVFNTIIEKLKSWKEIAIDLKDGLLAGLFSSLITTFINVFATTAKRFIRAIREGIRSIIQSFKILFFRPKDMTQEEALKIVVKSLSGVFITTVGIIAETSLNAFLQGIPVIGQFSSIITPVLLGMMSGISIALISYLVDILFDLSHKSEREFESLLKLSDIQIQYASSLNEIADSFFQSAQGFSQLLKGNNIVMDLNQAMLFSNANIIEAGQMVFKQSGNAVNDRKMLVEDSIKQKNELSDLEREIHETQEWIKEKKQK